MNALVVDDDAMARLILKQVLRRHFGAEVTEAPNGLEALVALEAKAFDLIILDLRMPVMDGLTVLQTIRANARHARTPVVMLTTDRKEENVYRSINLGVSDYLAKPFRGKDIAERLSQVLIQAASVAGRSAVQP